jgi:hypothetical protein
MGAADLSKNNNHNNNLSQQEMTMSEQIQATQKLSQNMYSQAQQK